MTDSPLYSPGPGEAPVSASTLSPSGNLEADRMTAINTLTDRMSGMGNDQFSGRTALAEAVHAEISAGGTGLLALGKTDGQVRGEQEAAAAAPDTSEPKPGATPAGEYISSHNHVFGDMAEAHAFGEALGAAGVDAGLVRSALQDISGDRRVANAVRGGEAGINARVLEVRDFFDRQPGGRERMLLGVKFMESLADKNPALEAALNTAVMSENAIHMAASEAERLGFKPGR